MPFIHEISPSFRTLEPWLKVSHVKSTKYFIPKTMSIDKAIMVVVDTDFERKP
jgi:hypothetical protein